MLKIINDFYNDDNNKEEVLELINESCISTIIGKANNPLSNVKRESDKVRVKYEILADIDDFIIHVKRGRETSLSIHGNRFHDLASYFNLKFDIQKGTSGVDAIGKLGLRRKRTKNFLSIEDLVQLRSNHAADIKHTERVISLNYKEFKDNLIIDLNSEYKRVENHIKLDIIELI